jgi:hypothetical protein
VDAGRFTGSGWGSDRGHGDGDGEGHLKAWLESTMDCCVVRASFDRCLESEGQRRGRRRDVCEWVCSPLLENIVIGPLNDQLSE